jgi:hypothetical protein
LITRWPFLITSCSFSEHGYSLNYLTLCQRAQSRVILIMGRENLSFLREKTSMIKYWLINFIDSNFLLKVRFIHTLKKNYWSQTCAKIYCTRELLKILHADTCNISLEFDSLAVEKFCNIFLNTFDWSINFL